VDPVPREVAEADRRNARGAADGERQRGDVADDDAGAELAEHARLAGGACNEIAMERRSAADRIRFVERQRVDLDDARIGLERAECDLPFDGEVEEPPGGGGPDAD